MEIRARKKSLVLTMFALAAVISMAAVVISTPTDADDTYDNLYDSVQWEIDAAAHYRAFADIADAEGYPVVARLFRATADAEQKHADDQWAILVSMGAAVKPTAGPVTFGTTAQNLQAAFDGETYEYTVLYPAFRAAAVTDGRPNAERIFDYAQKAEEIHAGNFADVMANLSDSDYLKSNYGTVYRCQTCGEVVNTLPASRCPICFALISTYVTYNATYFNLYASVQGETNAAAAYRAFADIADAEGYPVVARLFRATADAEQKHADDQWAILVSMGATVRPTADPVTFGTTAENVLAAFDGETYEYTVMYPGFLAAAVAEGQTDAATIFGYASRAEEVHAGNFADVRGNLGNNAYLNSTYGTVYRCQTCGEVVNTLPASRCPICYALSSTFVTYNATYFNLYASVQGETNAAAHYRAFADIADADGYPVVARLFRATADAEQKHADDQWAILVSMGATVRPTADPVTFGTTAENVLAAFDGETYEYTVMYPGFLAAAVAEGQTDAATIFNYAMRAEEVHAGNFADVRGNLGNNAYLNSTYGTVYRCQTCGEVVNTLPATRCPICYALISTYVTYNATYFNLYASVQGETNAAAHYRAFADIADAEGYPVVARLFRATADAEQKHADDQWAILVTMGATVRPTADPVTVGTTAENVLAAFDGETYEYTVMYPGFLAAAVAEGQTDAATIFNYAMRAEEVHAGNFADVRGNLGDNAYLSSKYSTLFRCIKCGEVVIARPANCPICGESGSTFVVYNATYFNLYASVQGETNAAAHYRAFADIAEAEGYLVIAQLFRATADAEEKHANDEWAILVTMGATVRPTAEPVTVGTTAENLLAAFTGETYEYTVMYPAFLAAATAEGQTAAALIFGYAMGAEEVHAGNFADVKGNPDDIAYLITNYNTVYRCLLCGEVVKARPANCPICGALGTTFAVYGPVYTYVTFMAAQTGGVSGTTDSTGIVITFDASVSNLTETDITITNGTGMVSKGTLSGSGTTWTIALSSVTAEGNVTVSIADFYTFIVNTGPQNVAVYKYTPTPVNFTAVQTGGVSGTTDSTGIVITFDASVSNLTEADITITDGTGTVTKGTLTGAGDTWTIALSSVTLEGNVTVSIADFDTFAVTTGPQIVDVYKYTPTPVTFTAVQTGGASGTAHSTGIVLTFSTPVANLTAADVSITNGTGTATKGALTGAGDTWTIALSSVTKEGNVTVSVADFDTFEVTTVSQTVAIYRAIPLSQVSFTAVQTGGTIDTANSTGIVLTFSAAVTGLTVGNITITNGTGAVTKGSLSGSGMTWTIALSSVTAQGNVTVSVSNFGSFIVTGGAKTVMVYAADKYQFTKGADGFWAKGSNEDLELHVDTIIANVTGATVDGALVSGENFIVTENDAGNAVVTLKASFLETLPVGEHLVKVLLTDGTASTKVTVQAEDSSGSNNNTMVIVAAAAVVVIGAVCVAVYVLVIRPKI